MSAMQAVTGKDAAPPAAGAGQGARRAPERTCIVTRRSGSPDGLLRFVLGPDGVTPDIAGRLPGRGVWVTATRECVAGAVRRKLFARAFRAQVPVAEDLPGLVDDLLARSALGTLAMARKAGQLITGFDAVERAARAGKLGLVLHAADGAADGLRKARAALTAAGEGGEVPVVREFTSSELNLALGLTNVIHAALPKGPMAEAVRDRAARLMRYRGREAAPQAHAPEK